MKLKRIHECTGLGESYREFGQRLRRINVQNTAKTPRGSHSKLLIWPYIMLQHTDPIWWLSNSTRLADFSANYSQWLMVLLLEPPRLSLLLKCTQERYKYMIRGVEMRGKRSSAENRGRQEMEKQREGNGEWPNKTNNTKPISQRTGESSRGLADWCLFLPFYSCLDIFSILHQIRENKLFIHSHRLS